MTSTVLQNYILGGWYTASTGLSVIPSALDGAAVAQIGSSGIDFAAAAAYARQTGGPALRALTFHERAKILRGLADAINARKEELYALSAHTGATRTDSWIDIEGGAATLFTYASKGRRELPNDRVLIDGGVEALSKRGSFVGQHLYTSLQGVAVHINAFNFPVWGMLEKLGPTLLAGVPAIVKPATASAYVTEHCVRIMVETGLLPEGALQLIAGSTGDLFDHLTGQDVVSFTGSAATAQKLQNHPVIARESVRFVAERDSLNATVLGPDATPETPEFDLFIKEIVREMTVKAGQKCTAIRRAFVPSALMDAVEAALRARLEKVVVGNPVQDGVTMGALISTSQLRDVRGTIAKLAEDATIVFGDPNIPPPGTDADGAFISPVLLRCDAPWAARNVHEMEAFGPVSTLMPYTDLADAIALCNRGAGSLVMSLFTHDPDVAVAVVEGAASFHGRVLINDRDCARESTGHGSPLPALVHGGPGRAGGGEEMGGIRGVKHYMQRTALQGSPRILSAVTRRWISGAPELENTVHPFRESFTQLALGKTFTSPLRVITLDDIEHFANFTGDTFYAHMDEEAAAANPFFPGRVAHGYLILSFAAGLFVDPAPGPVLANYGLENLRFLKPVSPGDSIKVRLTAKAKNQRNAEYGEVTWDALVTNQDDDTVASYELLTMNAI
ncbi:phenylacetic acid degradation bifunctional protein PaaZ [Acidocella aromatica]|uniref:Oxepin-CoA hydrolase/3-oxo-5,6-dehydrosuberyl-CoA semialdehyde dehydrogenase n=1 Tax=Acidocella aromatica TaxID=1303579 RepID=A0A840VB60_9PROT|nr:phenylacetic acid degradation bifunctional protein PaaZ [Acidocella aromatica]MBB5373013.1 oxepin-CoA hydrolase/3-oxo-5,6-dehydrosuberyl-CoA semialdehyde dehydrogenase [Acidocella aromatica]